jgi:hypothetical protein
MGQHLGRMHIMTKKKYTYAARTVLCVFAAVAALVLTPRGKSVTPFAFTTVTPTQLAGAGVTLSDPQAPVPGTAVSASAAAQVASAMNNSAVKEVHYMHCANTWVRPQINQDCYAVSIDPTNTPILGDPDMSTNPKPATWELVMVSPSGQVIDDTGGNN